MELKRDNIKEFNIEKEYMKGLLDVLEKGLEEVETQLEDEVIYTVINNIIEFKYEEDEEYKRFMGTNLEKYDKKFALKLIKRVLADEDNQRINKK